MPSLLTVAMLVVAAVSGAAIVVDPILPLGALGLLALWFMPRGWLLAGAIVLARIIGTGLSLTDVLLVVWLIRTVLPLRRLTLPPAGLWLVGFLAWAWLSILLVGGQPLALGRVTLYAAVSLLALRDADRQFRPVALAVLAYATVELVLTAPALLRVVQGDRDGVRLLGATVGDPHLLGFLLLAAYCLLRFRLVTLPGRGTSPLMQAVFIVGALMTMRRLVWLAVIVVLILPFAKLRTARQVVVVCICTAALGWLLYTPISERFDLNEEARTLRASATRVSLDAARRSPVVGVGWGSLGEDSEKPDATFKTGYNLPTYVAAATGVPGALFLFGWLLATGRRLWGTCPAVFWWFLALLVTSVAGQPIYAGSMATVMLFILVGLSSGRTDASTVGHASRSGCLPERDARFSFPGEPITRTTLSAHPSRE